MLTEPKKLIQMPRNTVQNNTAADFNFSRSLIDIKASRDYNKLNLIHLLNKKKAKTVSMFNFVSDDDFRNSLESDYQELNASMGIHAWKAVHVLSGSIIEALLVDYLLIASQSQQLPKKPLSMSFDELIKTCAQQKIGRATLTGELGGKG